MQDRFITWRCFPGPLHHHWPGLLRPSLPAPPSRQPSSTLPFFPDLTAGRLVRQPADWLRHSIHVSAGTPWLATRWCCCMGISVSVGTLCWFTGAPASRCSCCRKTVQPLLQGHGLACLAHPRTAANFSNHANPAWLPLHGHRLALGLSALPILNCHVSASTHPKRVCCRLALGFPLCPAMHYCPSSHPFPAWLPASSTGWHWASLPCPS